MEKIIIEQEMEFEEAQRFAERKGKTLIMCSHENGKTILMCR